MMRSQRRAELAAKVLAACKDLIGRGVRPTGGELRVLCPGFGYGALVAARDALVETGRITVAQFWGPQTDASRWTIGPAACWAKHDRFIWGVGPGDRNHPHPKRRDSRRSAAEVQT